jgi:hypothetical protein
LSRRNLLQGLVKVCIRWEWRPGQGERFNPERRRLVRGFHSGRNMLAEASAPLTGGFMNQVC